MSGRLLILGGSGILSTDVCRRALEMGYEITCITRGTRDFALPKGLKKITGNINNLKELENKLDSDYDAVLDFLSFDVTQLESKLAILGSICRQYIFVSSATVYSTEDKILKESSPLMNEYWDYGKGKIECENYLRTNYKQLGITYTIIRPYVTYGNTRIPFGIIPEVRYWSLANRILVGKPILLWDDGAAICTITHTTDFAKGFVGLINNPNAYNAEFHITSNEEMTWKKVLCKTAYALGKDPIIFSANTQDIIKILPEYRSILLGDKARDRIFDNSKICNTVSEFKNFKLFEEGIKETIEYYQRNDYERKIDYVWDGRVDRAIIKLAKKDGQHIDKSKIKFSSSELKVNLKDRFDYCAGRYWFLIKARNFYYKIKHLLINIRRK